MARLAKPPIISAIAMPINVLVSLIRTESCRNTHLLLDGLHRRADGT